MTIKTFAIPNISCGHCVNAIKNELLEQTGITSVEGDPGTRTITVEFQDSLSEESIRATLKEINYPAQ